MLSIIVAASENNVIGKNNQLPWHLPKDLRFFKNNTWAMPVIMGRKTFEAMGKPLPGRMNIVITANKDATFEGAHRATSLNEAIEIAETANCNEIFVIGGGEIFKQALPMAEKLYLTRIHAVVDGDIFFPKIDEARWQLQHREEISKDEHHQYNFSFMIFKKRYNPDG